MQFPQENQPSFLRFPISYLLLCVTIRPTHMDHFLNFLLVYFKATKVQKVCYIYHVRKEILYAFLESCNLKKVLNQSDCY